MPVTGPDFISLQVTNLDGSRAFYERYLGVVRAPVGPPHAVVFQSATIAFALRELAAETDLTSRPGNGIALWLHATDVQAIHDDMVANGETILTPIFDGPFGRTFAFADPDGYSITLHDRE